MSEVVDIEGPLRQMCSLLGLIYSQVKELRFAPSGVTAVVYLLNDEGQKFINDDGDPATETMFFLVRT